MIFSVIVCGSLLSGGYQNSPTSSELYCVLNHNPSACGYGIGIGILSNVLCILFLLLDIFEDYIFSDLLQNIIFISDIFCSVSCSIVWSIGFIFLVHEWSWPAPFAFSVGTRCARASIAATFFSVPCWVTLSYLAILRFRSLTSAYTPDPVYEKELQLPYTIGKPKDYQIQIEDTAASNMPALYFQPQKYTPPKTSTSDLLLL
ncbi:synaptogyrin-4 isoform X2 [Hyperolius riggenbachi]|uniref:synaptogyrin-4 isoform X2 n=1 Tax=Hyperolius riggenbachi TaxID=752182 RepID=UPI0035A26E66